MLKPHENNIHSKNREIYRGRKRAWTYVMGGVYKVCIWGSKKN
jgi:hypothetical protein